MKIVTNEAGWDRIVRVILGLVLIGAGIGVIQGAAGIVVAAIGLILLVTGVTGFCLLYALLGITTRPGRHG